MLLDQAQMLRLTQLQSQPRPPQILDLDRRIEYLLRQAELKANITGRVCQSEIERIVDLKLELEAAYLLWIDGKLPVKPK